MDRSGTKTKRVTTNKHSSNPPNSLMGEVMDGNGRSNAVKRFLDPLARVNATT